MTVGATVDVGPSFEGDGSGDDASGGGGTSSFSSMPSSSSTRVSPSSLSATDEPCARSFFRSDGSS